MAILLDFEKVREDDRTIEYRFGRPEMTRRLVIEKESLEGWIPEPAIDPDTERIYNLILEMFREAGAWPRRGMYAA